MARLAVGAVQLDPRADVLRSRALDPGGADPRHGPRVATQPDGLAQRDATGGLGRAISRCGGSASGRREAVAVRVALEVVLILGLGRPEEAGLADPGDELAWPVACGIDVGDRALGNPPLLVARTEDLGAVVGANDPLPKVSSVDL